MKVSDFGIAKARHQLHERTKTGEVKGKFGYLAPEQITGTKGDRRIDIYAMGCVLYVATMGLRPFGNGPKAMTKILLGEYRKPSDIDPMYPPGLEEIIVKSLAHEPENRFQTAGEMREALEKWLIDSRQIVTAADVARELTGRMHPEALDAIKKLQARRRGNRTSFGALLEAFDELEPPTASSGLVSPPLDLEAQAKKTPTPAPEDLLEAEDPTIRTVSRAEDTVREHSQAEGRGDQSGWHKTGRVLGVTAGAPQTIDVSGANGTLPPHRRRPLPQTEAGLRGTRAAPSNASADWGLLIKAGLFGVVFALALWFLLK